MDWECAWVDVPLDRADPASEHVAGRPARRPVLEAGDDRRPLVIEPGRSGRLRRRRSPGRSSTCCRSTCSTRFYPVGWDPRGVGLSRPAIDCGRLDAMDIPDADECIERTGELLGHVGAADAALDLEEVRIALGVERLDYLGYSYGTALGAVYAMAHPDRVGRFVLDGAIDPTAGDPDGPLATDGVPDYAADELDAVVARFHELCDASDRVRGRARAARGLIDELAGSIRVAADRPTSPATPRRCRRLDLDELVDGVTFDPWTWGLIGDALRDGADGDASTLAALIAYQLEVYPAIRRRRQFDGAPTSPSTAPTSATSTTSGAARGCLLPPTCR